MPNVDPVIGLRMDAVVLFITKCGCEFLMGEEINNLGLIVKV